MIEVAASDPSPSNDGSGRAAAGADDPGQATMVEPLAGCGGGAVGAIGPGSGAGAGSGAAVQVDGAAAAAGSWPPVEPGAPARGPPQARAPAAAGRPGPARA